MLNYTYCKRKILLPKNTLETYVYDLDKKKFLLSKNGILTVKNWIESENVCDEENIVENEINNIKTDLEQYGVDVLVFNSAEICNLKCAYCFANEGTYNSDNHKKTMLYSDYVRTYDIINDDHLVKAIEFFGGEPLLNYTEIRRFCEYVRKQRAKEKLPMPELGIITNGTLINKDVWNFLDDFGFKITISLDGPQSINDKNRVYKNGRGSYDDVMKNLDISGKKNAFTACEATLSCDVLEKMSVEEMVEYIDFFEKLPCKTVAILFAIDEDSEKYARKDTFIDKLEKFYEVYVEYCVSHIMIGDLKLYHTDIINAIKAFIVGGEFSYCRAGVRQIFINVSGEIYPCQRYYGLREKFGTVDDYEEVKKAINCYKDDIESRINRKCFLCEFSHMCQGNSCPGTNLAINNSENDYIELLCVVNKTRNAQVLKKLFEIITDHGKSKQFMDNLRNYLNMLGEK